MRLLLIIVQVCVLGMAFAMPGGSRSRSSLDSSASLIRLVPVSDDVVVQRSGSSYGVSRSVEPQVIRAVLVQADDDDDDNDDNARNFEKARYRFAYAVDDYKSGDSKHRQEVAEDGVITGFYTVQDADGRLRRVDYSASKDTGFVAKVTYDGKEGPVVVPTSDSNPNNEVVLVNSFEEADDGVILSRINLDESNLDNMDGRTFEVASSVPVVQSRSNARTLSLSRSGSKKGAQLIRLADGRTLAIVDEDDNTNVASRSTNGGSEQLFRIVTTNDH